MMDGSGRTSGGGAEDGIRQTGELVLASEGYDVSVRGIRADIVGDLVCVYFRFLKEISEIFEAYG